MKTAVCFFGFLRTFPEVAEGLMEHVIRPLNADVYVFCPDTFRAPAGSDHAFADAGRNPVANRVDPAWLREILGGDRVRGIETWSYDPAPFHSVLARSNLPAEFVYANGRLKQATWRMMSMFHHIDGVLALKERVGDTYQRAILMRPDLRVHGPLRVAGLDLTAIHHPAGEGFHPDGSRRIGAAQAFGLGTHFNDQFLLSNDANIQGFAGISKRVVTYGRSGVAMNNETMMAYDCRMRKVPFQPSDLVTYEIWRGDDPRRDAALAVERPARRR